jgi:hypothetical protein
MKKLNYVLLLSFVFLLFAGCSKLEIQPDPLNSGDESALKSAKTSVTMGFNIVFTGTYDFADLDPICVCDDVPMVRIINTGEGTGSHFGKLTHYFDFCVGVGSSYPNCHMVAYFEDENGDRLFVEVAGWVLGGRVPGMPNFATSYFKDPFEIIGGTGRFEDATGSGITNDYNSSKDPYSHHHWTGKITMVKGKGNF